MSAEKRQKIAFIGLGRMGLPMAQNLVKKGFFVTGSDLSQDALEAFTHSGGLSAPSAKDAAQGAEVVICMLPTSGIVRECLIGEGDALSKVAPGALVIDMSSSRPSDTLELGQTLAARGLRLLDAPVSGGVQKAITGTLAIMAGGAYIEEARPYLEAMGQEIFSVGPLGAGHAMKVLNNYVSAAGAVAAMEALIIGKEFGIEQKVVTDILNASTGRNNTTQNKVERFVLSGAYNSGFDLSLMAKDVGLAHELAQGLHVSAPLLAQTAQDWSEADHALGRGADHTEIYRFVAERARA